MVTRRGLLGGIVAAPWVIRSGVLMPVRPTIIAPPAFTCAFLYWGASTGRLAGKLIQPQNFTRVAAERLFTYPSALAVGDVIDFGHSQDLYTVTSILLDAKDLAPKYTIRRLQYENLEVPPIAG